MIRLLFAAFLLTSCASSKIKSSVSDDAQKELANRLAQKYIIADGHVDLPYRLKVKNFQLEKQYVGIPVKSAEGDFDFERAKKGGLKAPFMSIYIPASYEPAGAQLLADSLITMVKWIADQNKTYYEVATTPADVIRIAGQGKIALPMGMENGSPIATLADVKGYRQKGISYITLTHSKDNKICDSSYDTTKTWKGLSPYGREVVKEMAKEGILIDVSHISDNSFYQVIEISPVPVIASHSSARKFTPGFERNMSDDMIKVMGKNNGVIMVNFGSTFVDGEVAKKRTENQKKLGEVLKAKGLTFRDDAAKAVIDEFMKANPNAFADVEQVADHVDHIVKLAGINHVGFGSDFDGVGDSLPTGLKDVADYPNLLYVLIKRGYSPADIEKICSGNIFRVWNAALDYAAKN
ncbi:membrane dipeptidase [Emticicia sp. CRIBPO]|uniref:dipeptidase n=1 Tax=Emticicia sp. CRIBPO TaxID=2683258 RepID=UPI0014128CF2|nr:dipeptidase [Emticicia sp. CRIBPO]NBA88826.1 membrane dipeptidase [Emticicia sp. CRIBPO]